MSAELERICQIAGEEAVRRYAGWDDGRFRYWRHGPIRMLGGAGLEEPVLRAYVRLVCEGIGQGYLSASWEPPLGLLDALLRDHVPYWLPGLSAERGLALLATVWNLGEGAAREARWIDRYLLSMAPSLGGPEGLERQLASWLRPVLGPVRPARWTGPFRVGVVDLRPSDELFLPGELRWIGPRLLEAVDRRREASLGVLLTSEGPRPLGPIAPGSALPPSRPAPALAWSPGRVEIGGQAVELPLLHEPSGHALAEGGFLAIATANSQRLWVVESLDG